jgi:hypothetical protein
MRGLPYPIRGFLAAAALLFASITVTILTLEAGVRIWDGIPLFSTENFVARALDGIHKSGGAAVYDPIVGWIAKPNTSWDAKGKQVQTGGVLTFGEFGIRMPSPEKVPLKQGSILMVGDSFGAGSEVDNAESFPAQLEKMTNTQVINAGTGGYALDQIVLRTEMLLPILKPRILLVQTRLEFGLSVDRMSIYGGAPKPYFTVRDGMLVLHNQPVPRLAAAQDDLGWLRSVFGHSYLVQYAMMRLNMLQWWVSPAMSVKFAVPDAEALEVGCLLMQRLAQLRDQYGIKMILVLQYSGVDGFTSPLAWKADRDRMLGCIEHQHLELVDSLDALRSAYQKDGLSAYQKLWVMHDNDRLYGHMSADGNRLIADLIYAHLFGHKTPDLKALPSDPVQKSK